MFEVYINNSKVLTNIKQINCVIKILVISRLFYACKTNLKLELTKVVFLNML